MGNYKSEAKSIFGKGCYTYSDMSDLVDHVKQLSNSDSVILIKASRFMSFDLIAEGMDPAEAAKKAREIYMNMSSGMAEGGMMDMGGMEMDLRGGGFVPIGRAEKADDVPARLSKNEFVFTADAVRAAGGGNIDKGADKMYATMKKLEDRVA